RRESVLDDRVADPARDVEQHGVGVAHVVEHRLDPREDPVAGRPARVHGARAEQARGCDGRNRDAGRGQRREPEAPAQVERGGPARSATASVSRSSAIAITTITIPARIARAGYEFSPLVTTSPRPLPPISPAMTTIESANRIVWLTPRRSVRRARGSCTFCR